MKSFKFITAALALAALLFTGCQEKESNHTGVDSSKPTPTGLSFDATNSSATVLAVYWDAREALAAGATSFTVQTPPTVNGGDSYDNTVSQTLSKNSICDAAAFNKLTAGNTYYIRVRANYPNSVYSKWVYINVNDEPAQYEMGAGFINTKLAGIENLAYDATNSTSNSIVMTFDDTAATSANASGASIQLVDFSSGKTITQNISMAKADASSVSFTGLTNGKVYKLRARALYTVGDVVYLSNWKSASAEAKNDANETVTTEYFKVGTGPVAVPFVPPVAKLAYATSSSLAFTWSETNFSSATGDIARPYSIQLYSDESCSKLIVSWAIDPGNAVWSSATPQFLFSGLKANTTYYFKVTDTESKFESAVIPGTTSDFTVVDPSTSGEVAVGSVALAEDFSELVWGGDYMKGSAGYSATDRSLATKFTTASGVNPIKAEWGWYLVNGSTEIGLFNTLKGAVATSRLDKWGFVNETAGCTTGGVICARPGYVKIGASSYLALMTTPELSNLKETAKIKVTFKGCLYDTDPGNGAIYVINGGSKAASYEITPSIDKQTPACTFALVAGKEWKDYTFEIPNVTKTSRIAIGTIRSDGTASGKVQERMYLDDIVITVENYGKEVINLSAPVISDATPTADAISLTWGAVDKASGYTVEYKKSSDATYTSVDAGNATSYTLSSLTDNTSYDIRIQAYETNSGSLSAYSEVKTVSTIKKAAFPMNIGTADELIAFLTGADAATASATDVVNLTSDIDMTGKTFTSTATFAGVFNGNNHTIKNLKGTTPLFISLGSAKDLTIDAACSFDIPAPAGNLVFGTLAATSTGAISNVTNNAAVTLTLAEAAKGSIKLAGVVGESSGVMSNCNNGGAITINGSSTLSGSVVAGVVAYQAADITDCNNTGAVSVTATCISDISFSFGSVAKIPIHVAGVAGMMLNGKVTHCNNSGKITHKLTSLNILSVSVGTNRPRIAGIVAAPNGDISNCTNTGAIDVSVVQQTRSAYTTNNYTISVGGISGGDVNNGGENVSNITDCINNGNINIDFDGAKSNATVGGIVGYPGLEGAAQTILTKGCTNNGNITVSGGTKMRIGGIQGGAGNVEGCKNYGTLTNKATTAGCAIGGISGFNSQNLKFINNENYGDVTNEAAGAMYVSGLIANYGNVESAVATGCIVKCNVSTVGDNTNAGMVVGYCNPAAAGKTQYNVVFGTVADPIKVSGSISLAGTKTTLSATNFSDFLKGSTGAVQTVNAVYGE